MEKSTPDQQTAWFVGRKRPLSELKPEQQKKIREAYRDTGFAHNDSEEGICICLTEDTARSLCDGKPGWFYYELPIESCLPEDTVDFTGTHFPASDTELMPLLEIRAVNLNDPISVESAAIEALRRASIREKRKLELMEMLMTVDV